MHDVNSLTSERQRKQWNLYRFSDYKLSFEFLWECRSKILYNKSCTCDQISFKNCSVFNKKYQQPYHQLLH